MFITRPSLLNSRWLITDRAGSFLERGVLCPASGFAIGIILVAVSLVAMLGLALAIGSNTNIGYNNVPKEDAYAAALISEARNLHDGVALMTVRGTPISSLTFDMATTTGLFNPSNGGTDFQTPPAGAMTNSTSSWIWKVDASGNPVVKLYNVGSSSNADYVAVLPNIAPHTCQQINAQLHHVNTVYQFTAASATFTNLTTAATAVDLSASNANTQGWDEGCYNVYGGGGGSGPFVYLVTIREE